MIGSTLDPDGRTVTLEWDRWLHIVRKHRNLGVGQDVLLEVVAAPDETRPGRMAGEWWFYRRGAGPTTWIKVVVHYEGDRGSIVTAFPRRAFP